MKDCIISYDMANPNQLDNVMRAVPLKIGLKVEVDECIMNTIKDTPYIKEHFKLNIKRLNRYRWSIYFDNNKEQKLIFLYEQCKNCIIKSFINFSEDIK